MRNDVFCPDSFRLNAPGGLRKELDGDWLPLNSHIHRIHKEKEKRSKKERERTATTIFVSKIGNSNCRQREIIIDVGQNGVFQQFVTCFRAGIGLG